MKDRLFAPRYLGSILACLILFTASAMFAAGTNVNIVDFAFSPTSVSIKPNDSVTWTWTGAFSHSSTGQDTNLWNSGIHGNGFVFSHTFPGAGSFPYHCMVHPTMLASVTVQGQVQSNAAPSTSISSPTNGSVFVAPWSGRVSANSSDSDGTVAKVEFFAGPTSLGSITNPLASATLVVTNLVAGNYALTVVATDNHGATTTSTAVNISIVSPSPIALGDVQIALPASVQFSYTATSGLSYLIERSSDLTNWSPLATNTAAGGSVSFTDNAASGAANFYRVQLLANP